MTSDVDVELEGLEVSLVSWLRWLSGLQTQVVAGAPWDGRKLVGWEQFFKRPHSRQGARKTLAQGSGSYGSPANF